MPRLPFRMALLCLLSMLAACAGTAPRDQSARGADPTAQLALARVLLRTDPPRAEQVLQAALAAAPRNADMLNDLGIARDLQGHHAEAQAAYRQALSAAPNLRGARVNLALSLALSGDSSAALAAAQPLGAADSHSGAEQADLAAINALTGASVAGK